ncbi:MAG TPA: flagellar export chaperone FliS [Steroidobacteraceae bacterium]|nr:flagellar export chaperone FliS [Steroidobacteraceae bacterium]
MNAQKSRLAAYESVSVQGGVAAADPHGLIVLLMDGAMERMATARGCIEHREIVRKAKLLHSAVRIIAELRGVLNLAQGGAIAQNLSDLYDYMARRLILANAQNDVGCINEVMSLLGEIRGAWVAIGPQVRQASAPGALGGGMLPSTSPAPAA